MSETEVEIVAEPEIDVLRVGHTIPLCCPRTELCDGIFMETEDRRMHFYGGTSDGSWHCLRCDMSVTANAEVLCRPICNVTCARHIGQVMVVDLHTGNRYWSCFSGRDCEGSPEYAQWCTWIPVSVPSGIAVVSDDEPRAGQQECSLSPVDKDLDLLAEIAFGDEDIANDMDSLRLIAFS